MLLRNPLAGRSGHGFFEEKERRPRGSAKASQGLLITCFSIARGLPIIIMCFALFVPSLHAAPLKRTILVLHDSTEDAEESDEFRFTRYSALVLNHLGMKMRFHDMSTGLLPPDSKLEDVHGILTWFKDDVMFGAEAYLKWLKKQIDKGTKVAMMEEVGAEVEIFREKDPQTNKWKEKPVKLSLINEVFNSLGLEFKANFMKKTFLLELTHVDPSMMNFERDIKFHLTSYIHVVSKNPKNKIYLKAQLKGRENSATDLVVTTPQGAYAGPDTAAFDGTSDLKQQGWLLNPFTFFSEAFEIEDRPKPDYTTLYGNRILYAHIDGDGFNNISHIDRKSMSSEIIYEKILKKYTIPHSVSVVVAEIDPKLTGNEKSIPVARDILKLSHIEVGSHGYAHPFDWKVKKTKTKDGYNAIPQMHDIHKYKDIDFRKEIEFSSHWINEKLLEVPKKVKIFQWTGSCNPPEEALKIPYEIGLLNLNGGDTQFDANWPTLFGVAPLASIKGHYIQYLTSNSNENIYTNKWQGPFSGYKKVIETFQNTDKPKRLSPMNIYYHFYSGERLASLNALETVYDYTLKQNHVALFPSDYIHVAEGFESTRIDKVGAGWIISHNGNLRTIRFDALKKYPDFTKSQGIVGFNHHGDSLYIHLDDSPTHTLFLTNKKPLTPYLQSSNVMIKNWNKKENQLSFEAQGYETATIHIAGLRPDKKYDYVIGKIKASKTANKEGILSLKFAAKDTNNILISLK